MRDLIFCSQGLERLSGGEVCLESFLIPDFRSEISWRLTWVKLPASTVTVWIIWRLPATVSIAATSTAPSSVSTEVPVAETVVINEVPRTVATAVGVSISKV